MNYLRIKNRVKHILLCKMCFLTFFFFSVLVASGQETTPVAAQNIHSQQQTTYRIVFWNVENLFDTENDSLKNDDAFTPEGENHWTRKRYRQKLTSICRVLTALGGGHGDASVELPAIVGLAEVENDRVLRELCKGTALRRYGYSFVHHESPDARGIDNALLYRTDYYQPFYIQAIDVSDSTLEIATRDILLVEGTTREGDTLIILVNHFPSKRGGTAADIRRDHVAKRLRESMDTVRDAHPGAAIVVMGDLNASPDEPEVAKTLMHGSRYVNLMAEMESGTGSHNYQGVWTFLDQIIVEKGMLDGGCRLQVAGKRAFVFAPGFMLTDDERHLGKKPFRTYQAMMYLGGYSDHLPVYIDIHPQQKLGFKY